MRTFNTIILALGLGATLGACDVESIDGEPTVIELRAKAKTPCGGLLGLQCEPNQTCIDDPSDSCDPDNGGADCIGMCVNGNAGGNGGGNGNGNAGGNGNGNGNGNQCNYNSDPSKVYIGQSLEECAVIHFICSEGSHYFSDECGCGCENDL